MPELSFFYGIHITMRFEKNTKHHLSHFHVYYAGFMAVYSCEGELLSGHLPPKQHKLVTAWACLHETELEENWLLASNNFNCYKIDPLH